MPSPGPELTFVGEDETDPRKVLLKKDGTYLRTSRSVWQAVQSIKAQDAALTASIPKSILDAATNLLEPDSYSRPQRAQPRARIEVDLKSVVVAIAARIPSERWQIAIAGISFVTTAIYIAFNFHISVGTIDVITSVKIVTAMFFIITIHELAHAAVATRYGCATHRLGIGIFFIIPVFYADVSEIWRLTRRRRFAINVAGIAAQLGIGSALVAGALAYPDSVTLKSLIWANLASILLNLIPFAKLDGYWLLADAIDVPNLQARAFAALRHLFSRHGNIQARSQIFIVCYGLAGALFYAAIAGSAVAALWSIGSVIINARSWDELSAVAASRPVAWLFGLYTLLWIIRFASKLVRGTKP